MERATLQYPQAEGIDRMAAITTARCACGGMGMPPAGKEECTMETSTEILEKLRRTGLFDWLPQEGVEMFQNCFDLETACLPAGERRDFTGQLGLLLSGSLVCGGTVLAPGALLGAARDGGGRLYPAPFSVSARQDSEIALWDGAVLTAVCYRACWFHGRFVLEAEKWQGMDPFERKRFPQTM